MSVGIHPSVHDRLGGRVSHSDIFADVAPIDRHRGVTTLTVRTRVGKLLDYLLRADIRIRGKLGVERQR